MKMILIISTVFILSGQVFAQDRTPEGTNTIPPTQEEKFYDGDQLNPDAFSQENNPSEVEEEEVQEFEGESEDDEIIYPYETINLDEEEYNE